jgi:hypothetical protein
LTEDLRYLPSAQVRSVYQGYKVRKSVAVYTKNLTRAKIWISSLANPAFLITWGYINRYLLLSVLLAGARRSSGPTHH